MFKYLWAVLSIDFKSITYIESIEYGQNFFVIAKVIKDFENPNWLNSKIAKT